MLEGQQLKQKLATGQPCLGCWINFTDPCVAELLTTSGFDFFIIDAEHAALGIESVQANIMATKGTPVAPMVRVPWNDPVLIKRVLDAGAWGIVYPHVSTPEQAEKLARAMRYPPRGSRSAGTGRCVTLGSDYRSTFDDAVLCIPQIEDLEGVDNAEAIASVEGVDVGFLGPGDLALSMGVEQGHPDHEAALQRLREGCERAGVPSGIPVPDAAAARRRIAEGFTFIDLSSDFRMMESAAKQALADAQNP